MTIGATTVGTRSTTIRRLAFVALAWLAVGVTWVGGIGRYGGPDEPAHVLRAYAVAHGDVLGVRTAGLPSGYRAVTVPRSLGTGDPTCYRHDPTLPSTCSTPAPADASGDTAFVATSAGVAPPLYYALVGVPVRLVGAVERVYLDDRITLRNEILHLFSLADGIFLTHLLPIFS